jgi:hypothetical protein
LSAARFAGDIPNIIPTRTDTPKAINTDIGLIIVRIPAK